MRKQSRSSLDFLSRCVVSSFWNRFFPSRLAAVAKPAGMVPAAITVRKVEAARVPTVVLDPSMMRITVPPVDGY
jgi:hypothetical protein